VVKPLLKRVVVCNPRHNRIEGSRNDKIDARTLAKRLRLNGTEPGLQSAAKAGIQKRRHACLPWSVSRVLPGAARDGDARGDGTPGGGAENGSHGAGDVEKRREFRRGEDTEKSCLKKEL
jgi:hypothetical protein